MALDETGPAYGSAPIRISDEANDYIEQWAWALRQGHLQLWQLPQSLQTLHSLGFFEGRASLQPELDRANSDADRYYTQLFNPRKPLAPGISLSALEQRRNDMYRPPDRTTT